MLVVGLVVCSLCLGCALSHTTAMQANTLASKLQFQPHHHTKSQQTQQEFVDVDGLVGGSNCDILRVCSSAGGCARVCSRGSVVVSQQHRRAIGLQNALAKTRSLCDTQLMGSHNSAITLADGYGVDQTFMETHNQFLSLTDQLNLGVRHIELDTHAVNGKIIIAHCGGVHINAVNAVVDGLNAAYETAGYADMEWDTETIGCYPTASSILPEDQRTFVDALQEIKAWLLAPENLNELVVLFLDDRPNLIRWKRDVEVESNVQATFGDLLLTVKDVPNFKSKTIGDWIQLGKRVLVYSSVDLGRNHTSILSQEAFCNHTSVSYASYAQQMDANTTINEHCAHSKPEMTTVYSSELVLDRVARMQTNILDEVTVVHPLVCGAVFVSPDRITPSRITAMSWTAAALANLVNTTALNTTSTITMNTRSGTWTAQNETCALVACRCTSANSQDCRLGDWSAQKHACGGGGWQQQFPATAHESFLVRLRAQEVGSECIVLGSDPLVLTWLE